MRPGLHRMDPGERRVYGDAGQPGLHLALQSHQLAFPVPGLRPRRRCKNFLGETGRFNGEDIIDIIARQEPTARFICTRLFQFFAADQVDEEGGRSSRRCGGPISHPAMRYGRFCACSSDYFKSKKARYARVKGPVELVVGVVRMAGTYHTPPRG